MLRVTQFPDEGVRVAQGAGCEVRVVLTPSAARGWGPRVGELEALTGHPVRSGYKPPGETDRLPRAMAMVVAPMSCTTLNKWGAGIADTLAIGLPSEGVHLRVPVVPCRTSTVRRARSPRWSVRWSGCGPRGCGYSWARGVCSPPAEAG
ncbi:flavoprotein [Streptomyces sp. NPDC049906]|uniref:flavoprotein n=1 Tax=Streptomyces sp. NPDC049906 TaxID=3155656 RepID=UPI00343E2B7B